MIGLGDFKNWSPIIAKLVWPVFALIILIAFKGEIFEIYALLKKEVAEEGRSFETPFFKLGESASKTSIATISLADVSIEAIGSSTETSETAGLESELVTKGSLSELDRIKRRLSGSPLKKVDVLAVTDRSIYSGEALKTYIATLGVRFIVFQKSGKFDKWIYASNLVGQLEDKAYSYAELTSEIVGVSSAHVKDDSTVSQVLEKMKFLRITSLPVVDANDRLKFFTDRGEILSSLLTSLILPESNSETE